MPCFQLNRYLFAVVLFVVSAVSVSGQTATGTVSGRVTDSGGGLLVGATVELKSIERGTVLNVPTNQAGFYLFPSVQPGQYRMDVRAAGFKQAQVQNLAVDVGGQIAQNFTLELGSVQQSVTVDSSEVLVNTVSPTVSMVVTGAPIQDLPLNGRDTLQLALTQPGVMPSAINPVDSTGLNTTNQFAISGGRPNSVTYMLDGGNNTSFTYGTPVVDPNPDTVGEFRILASNYTAEYGRSAGGIISVVTKSGTNLVHGTLYDYLRNTALDANYYFNQNTPGGYQARPILIRNQFGGTAGGPLTLPKIVNGKDRFFWFFGYQGQRQTAVQVEPQIATYTPAELTGDFSHSVTGGPDPNVAAFLASHRYFQPNAQLASQAIIDQTKINPVGQAYITNNLIPVSASGIVTPNGSATDNRDEFIGKFDFHVTPNDTLAISLVRFHNPQLVPFGGNQPNVNGYPGQDKYDDYFGDVAYTRVIRPTVLNEFHFTAQRDYNSLDYPTVKLPGPQALGINITPDLTTGPTQIFLNESGPQIGFDANGPAYYADTTYIYADSLTWNSGRHTFKFGGQIGWVQNNAYFAFQTNGAFSFDGPTGIGSGTDLADFLFGVPDNFQQWAAAQSAVRSRQTFGFAQDEWKALPNLTLTLGIRYEYSTPKRDPQNRNYMIILGDQSVKYPNAPLGLVFPGDPGAPPSGVNFPDRTNWAPRLGFAWDPTGRGKTSIRGGFGMFYDLILAKDNQEQNGTPPFYSASYIAFSPSEVPADGPSLLMSDPYGASGTVSPFPSKPLTASTNFVTAGLLPFGPSSVFIDPHMKTPYTFQYNLSLQQALGNGLVAELAYVGSASHKLIGQEDIDPFILGTTTRPWNTQPGLQYPDAYGYTAYTSGNYAGNANYNSLLISLNKRMGDWHSLGQMFFSTSYTWSHNLGDTDGSIFPGPVSYYNQGQFYGPTNSDILNRFVLSGGWELPFAHLAPNLPSRLTRGWSLFPILSAQSGFAVDVNAGLYQDGVTPGPSGDGDQNLVRPNWDGSSKSSLNPGRTQTFTVDGSASTGHFFFNPSGLVVPACYASSAIPGTPGGCPTYTYGTLQRNSFRGPDRLNLDIALEKKTNLVAERLQLLFRAEFFNALNNTQWQPQAVYSVNSPLVGQITSTYPARIGQVALKLVF